MAAGARALSTGLSIPSAFLKSSNFISRAQLQQVFAKDPRGFQARFEEPQAEQVIGQAVMKDYRAPVNSINQQLVIR